MSARAPRRVAVEGQAVTIRYECASPRMVRFQSLMSPEETSHIIEVARPALHVSRVVGSGVSEGRTSTSCRVPRTDKVIAKVLKRLSLLTSFSTDHFETVQVVHYDVTQEYRPHFDWFQFDSDPQKYADHLSRGGQRLITVFCYLNDVKGGGATDFPDLNRSFYPKNGDALLWYNRTEDGTMDNRVLHAGAPVTSGEKWGMNVWIRERLYLERPPVNIIVKSSEDVVADVKQAEESASTASSTSSTSTSSTTSSSSPSLTPSASSPATTTASTTSAPALAS